MSKSNYEKYCDGKQPLILQQTRTLQEAIDNIKSVKNIYASGVIEDYIAMVALLYNRDLLSILCSM
jgi:hypothetical protein